MGVVNTDWQLDSNVLGLLDNVISKAEKVDSSLSSLNGRNPFSDISTDVTKANQSLTGLIANYNKVTNQVKGLNHEQKTLVAIEKELIAMEQKFLTNGKYDQYERELKRVRDRLKEIGKETDKNTKEQKQYGQAVDKSKGSVNSLGSALKTAFTVTGILFLISKLVEVGAKIIDITGIGEKYQNQFTRIFNGNTEAAKGYLAILQKTADVTNFTFDELADNTAKLASRGIIPTQAEILKLGDAANFINKDISKLNEAILDANEPERWKELGFVVKTSGDQMTLSYGDFTKTVAKTTAGAYEAIQAFSEQKKVLGSTAEAGKTLSGQMSTLADNFAGVFRTIGQGNTGVLNKFIAFLSDILIGTKNLIKFLQPFAENIGNAFAGLGNAMLSVLRLFGNFSDAGSEMATTSQKIGFYLVKYLINPLTGLTLIIASAIEGFAQMFLYIELGYAKLSRNTALADSISKQIDESKKRLLGFQEDLKEVARVRDQTLADYTKTDNQRQRREDRRNRLNEEETEEAIAGINGQPKPPKTASDADKKKADKSRQDVYNKLLDAEKDYLKELEKLRTESRKQLLDQFDKDSISYLNAKKDLDLKEIQAEQDKLLQLKQLKAGKVFKDPKTGKYDIAPDKNTKLSAEENTLFDQRRNVINTNFEKDINANLTDQAITELELMTETTETLTQLENLKWQKKLNEAKKGTQLYENLIKARDKALAEIVLNGKLASVDEQASKDDLLVFADISAKRREGLISQKDFEQQLEAERIKLALLAAQERLDIVQKYGDLENKEVQEQIRKLKGQIIDLGNAGQEAKNKALESRSFYDLLFKSQGAKGDADDFGKKAEFYKEVVSGIVNFEAELAQQRVDAIQAQIDAKQTQLDKELELQRQGLANNSDLRAAELQQLKEARKRALAEAKAFQIAQQAIESLEQASSLVTAVANIFKVESKKGLAGLIIAGIGTALLLTLFKVQKSKAADAAREKTELGEGGELFGPSHKDGGIQVGKTNVWVEGGEFVTKKKVTQKHKKFLKALNAEQIETMNPLDVLKMLNPNWTAQAGASYDRTINDRSDPTGIPAYMWNMLSAYMETAGEYYRNAPTEQAVQVAPGVTKHMSKAGTRIEVDKKYMVQLPQATE